MREHAQDTAQLWSPYPDWTHAVIEKDGWLARPILGFHQLTVNGNVGAARAALAPEAKEVGLWGVAEGDPYLVRLAHDRALLVSQHPVQTVGTWQAAGWVASGSNDATLLFGLSGAAVGLVVSEATSANLSSGSPSASVLFAGVTVALYRSSDDCACVHVATDLAPYLWRWLETR